MREKIRLYPFISSDEVIVEFTKEVKLDKNVIINVPSDYTAFVFMKQKLAVRIEPCDDTNLLKYVGKDYNNSSVKVAYAKKTELPLISWGFGEINVKNDKLKQAYRVGANGKFLIKITDFTKLIKAFGNSENITIEKISQKAKSLIVTVGKPLLSKFFANTMISAFEINSLSGDLRNEMLECFKKEQSFLNAGIEILDLTINGIHVNDEDMELIRSSFNKEIDNTSNLSHDQIVDSIIKN